MFCQICLSTDPSSLIGIRGKYFELNHQQIDYLDCFTYCKQIKIKDELNAKFCTDCMLKLKVEYTSKQDRAMPSSSKAVTFNISFPDDEARPPVKPEASSSFQSVYPDPGIKAEPELLVDENECDDDDNENTPDQITINVYFETEEIFRTVKVTKLRQNVKYITYDDILFAAYLCQSQLELNQIAGFADQFGQRIDNAYLPNYIECDLPSLDNGFIVMVKREMVDKATNTSTGLDTTIEVDVDQQPPKKKQTPHKHTKKTSDLGNVSVENFREYLVKNNGMPYIEEFEENRNITDRSRKALITLLAMYVNEHFGLIPSHDQMMVSSLALLEIFPCLRTDNKELQYMDTIYNIATHKGFLVNKLKNMRQKLGRIGKTIAEVHSVAEKIEVRNDCYIEEMHFLLMAQLPEQLELVKENLLVTKAYRQEVIKSKGYQISLKTEFPFFFAEPKLIHFEFASLYPNATDFKQKFREIEDAIEIAVVKSGKTSLVTEIRLCKDWNALTLSILNLLRLVPPQPTGMKKNKRCTDVTAVDRLMVLHPNNSEAANSYTLEDRPAPYLIAIGQAKSRVEKYLVAVDGLLIPLEPNATFIEALDFLCKIYLIFQIPYDCDLRMFFKFIQHYLYTIPLEDVPTSLCYTNVKLNNILKSRDELGALRC